MAIYRGTSSMSVGGLRFCSLVLLSIVVPNASKFRFYGRVEGVMSYPVLFLATGALRRSVLFKLNVNTSSCVAGPFHVRRLHTHITTRLHERGERRRDALSFRPSVEFSLSTGMLCISRRPIPLAGDRCSVYRCLTGGQKRIFAGRRVCRTIFKFSKVNSGSAVSARVGGVHTGLRRFGVDPVDAM